MKKLIGILILLLLSSVASFAQISGAGQLGCNAAAVTGTGWTTATSVNTTQTLASGIAGASALVVLDQTTTLTVGAIQFQGDPGDGNLVNLAAWQVVDPTSSTYAQVSQPYTLQASTNKQFLIYMGGYSKLVLKLTTAITGTATVTPFTTLVCYGVGSPVTIASSVALPANQSTNEAQINGVAPLMGNGVSGTGSQRVNIASDNTAFTVNSAESGTWTVQPGNTPNTSPWLVQQVPGAANGLSAFVLEPAASDNHTNIKNGAGVVYHISAFNNSATVNYYRLYNAASGFNGCNSATNLLWEGHIPALTSDAGFVEDISGGITFSTGISICVTSGYGQTNTTSATASAISLNVGYK